MNGTWHTEHTEQMFLIIVVVVITMFSSEVQADPTQVEGITSTFFGTARGLQADFKRL